MSDEIIVFNPKPWETGGLKIIPPQPATIVHNLPTLETYIAQFSGEEIPEPTVGMVISINEVDIAEVDRVIREYYARMFNGEKE